MNLKKTSFWKAKEQIGKNKKKSLYIFCFDALFFVVLFFLSRITTQLMPRSYESYNQNLVVILLFVLSYFIFLILFYSLTKYFVLLIIKSIKGKARFILKEYYRFALLNVVSGLILFVVFGVLSLIVNSTVRSESISSVSIVFLVLVGLIYYFYINIVHVLFILNNKIWKSVKEGWGIVFKKGKIYFPIILNILIASVLYLVIYFILFLISSKIQQTQTAFFIFRTIFTILAGILFYKLLFLNRIQLFMKISK